VALLAARATPIVFFPAVRIIWFGAKQGREGYAMLKQQHIPLRTYEKRENGKTTRYGTEQQTHDDDSTMRKRQQRTKERDPTRGSKRLWRYAHIVRREQRRGDNGGTVRGAH
jgi:hypothetical protein